MQENKFILTQQNQQKSHELAVGGSYGLEAQISLCRSSLKSPHGMQLLSYIEKKLKSTKKYTEQCCLLSEWREREIERETDRQTVSFSPLVVSFERVHDRQTAHL